MEHPGEMVNNFGRPLASSARGLVGTIGSGIRGIGGQVQGALDQPAQAAGLKSSPFRIIHYPVDAVLLAAEDAGAGVVNSIERVAGGVTTGLDTVPQNLDPQTLRSKTGMGLHGLFR